MKKILILNPYLSTLGGGEKYMGYLCQFMEQYFGDVRIDILVRDYGGINSDKNVTAADLNEKFGLNLCRTHILKHTARRSSNILAKIYCRLAEENISKDYDIFINSMFFSKHIGKAKKNFYICMFPPKTYSSESGFLKKYFLSHADTAFIKSYDAFLPNSLYTDFWLTDYWQSDYDRRVIYPPVMYERDINAAYKEENKKNIILSVGRFFVSAHCKKQLETAEFFAANNDYFKNKGYEYHIAGSVTDDPDDREYLNSVRKIAANHENMFIHDNCSRVGLIKLYSQAKIFWHAAGFNTDIDKEPEKAEHFGISTAEAMGYGAVPVVINKGGQKEIVEHGDSGFLWDSGEECIGRTVSLIDNDDLRKDMAYKANMRSKNFSIDNFFKQYESLFKEYGL